MRLLSSVKRHRVAHTNNNTPVQPQAATEQLLSQHRDGWATNENKQPIFNSSLHFVHLHSATWLGSALQEVRKEKKREKGGNCEICRFSVSILLTTPWNRAEVFTVHLHQLSTVASFPRCLPSLKLKEKINLEQDKLILFRGSFAHLSTLHAGPCYADFPRSRHLQEDEQELDGDKRLINPKLIMSCTLVRIFHH